MTRVQVTGLGAMAPHGSDLKALFGAILRGTSAVHPVFPELPKPAAAAAAATVEFDASHWFTRLQLAGVDRVSQLAVAAADLALRDAGDGAAAAPVFTSAAAWAAAPRSTPRTAPARGCRR